MYDASIGRWNGVDILSEIYEPWSPYNYVLGSPINYIDPNGMSVAGQGSPKLEPTDDCQNCQLPPDSRLDYEVSGLL